MKYDRFTEKAFRKFALKLKREGLWNRFRILQYYFRVFNDVNNNSLYDLYNCLKNPSSYTIMNNRGYKVFGDGLRKVYVEEIFKYYCV